MSAESIPRNSISTSPELESGLWPAARASAPAGPGPGRPRARGARGARWSRQALWRQRSAAARQKGKSTTSCGQRARRLAQR
jgi:hypothetical protein